jgi:hypothetical protein
MNNENELISVRKEKDRMSLLYDRKKNEIQNLINQKNSPGNPYPKPNPNSNVRVRFGFRVRLGLGLGLDSGPYQSEK